MGGGKAFVRRRCEPCQKSGKGVSSTHPALDHPGRMLGGSRQGSQGQREVGIKGWGTPSPRSGMLPINAWLVWA